MASDGSIKKPTRPLRSRRSFVGAKVAVVVALVIGAGGWFYAALQPLVLRPCGSPGGPLVTAQRVRLGDGRFLAYAESGVPKEKARFKIVFCHGFSGTRLDAIQPSRKL